MVIKCHLDCKQKIQGRSLDKNHWRMTCLGCSSRTTVKKEMFDRTTVLGRKNLVKLPYPKLQCMMTEWSLPIPPNPGETQKTFTAPLHLQIPTGPAAPTHLQVPEMIVRTTSLPVPSASSIGSGTPGASSSSFMICLPPAPSPSPLHRSKSTSAIGHCRNSGTGTPSSPADSGQPRPAKRSTTEHKKARPKKQRK